MLLTDLFDSIAATKSVNEKISLLQKEDSSLLRFVLREAYSGQPKILVPSTLVGTGDLFFEDMSQKFMGANLTLNKKNNKIVINHQLRTLFSKLEPRSAELVRNILHRDLKCGISVSIINKALPRCINRLEFPKYKNRDINNFPIYSNGPDLVVFSKTNTHDCIAKRTSNGWVIIYKTGRVLKGFDYLNKSLDSFVEQLGAKSTKGLCLVGKLCSKTKDVSHYIKSGSISTDVLFAPLFVGVFGGFVAQDSTAFREIDSLWEPLPFLHRLPVLTIKSNTIPLVASKYYALGYDTLEVHYKDDLLGFKRGVVYMNTKVKPEFPIQMIVPCVVADVKSELMNYPVDGKLEPHKIISYLVVRQENKKEQLLLNGISKDLRLKYIDNPSDIIGEVVNVQCRGYDSNKLMNSPTYLSIVEGMYWESMELFVEDNEVF